MKHMRLSTMQGKVPTFSKELLPRKLLPSLRSQLLKLVRTMLPQYQCQSHWLRLLQRSLKLSQRVSLLTFKDLFLKWVFQVCEEIGLYLLLRPINIKGSKTIRLVIKHCKEQSARIVRVSYRDLCSSFDRFDTGLIPPDCTVLCVHVLKVPIAISDLPSTCRKRWRSSKIPSEDGCQESCKTYCGVCPTWTI